MVIRSSPVFLRINTMGAPYGKHEGLIQPFLRYSSSYHWISAISSADMQYYCLYGGSKLGSTLIQCTVSLSAGITGDSKKSVCSATMFSQRVGSAVPEKPSPALAHVSASMATTWLTVGPTLAKIHTHGTYPAQSTLYCRVQHVQLTM